MRKSESSGEGAVGVGVVGDLSVTDDPAPDGGVATHPSPTNGIKGGDDALRRIPEDGASTRDGGAKDFNIVDVRRTQ